MAYRKNRQRRLPASPALKPPVEEAPVRVRDGYSNPIANLGLDQPNALAASQYTLTRISQNPDLLMSLYRNDWIARRVVDVPAEDMTRNWYKINSQMPPERLDEMKALETRHSIKYEITTGIKWSRLFGGAGAIMVIKGQEDILDQPLDMRLIMPGDFRGLIVLDRWDMHPDGNLVSDMDDPDFGLPEYYHITVEAWKQAYIKVHHSRILRFPGRLLPNRDESAEEYWGASEFEHIFEELNKRNATSANIAQLVFQANLRVWKSDTMGEALSSGSDKQAERIIKAATMQNRMGTSFGMQLMGTKDSYESHQYTFAGVSDVYETFMMDMAGAAEMPATKLYGRAPQGMNATGESDQENYDEGLGQKQENQLRPALERLLPVMCMSLWGAVPDDLSISFEPVRPLTGEKRADMAQKNAATIQGAYTAGIVSQKIALQELREAGRPLGMWTHITDEDIANANASLDGGGEAMPLGLPAGYGGLEGQQPPNPTSPPVASDDMPAGDEGNSNSGNHGHGGRPGKVGGSQKGTGGGAGSNLDNKAEARRAKDAFLKKHERGEVNTRLQQKGGVDKHNPNTKEHREYIKTRKAAGLPPPSYFTEDPKQLYSEVISRIGDLNTRTSCFGSPLRIIQYMTFDRPIGYTYNQDGTKVETTLIAVVYSEKNGIHYYPDSESKKEDRK